MLFYSDSYCNLCDMDAHMNVCVCTYVHVVIPCVQENKNNMLLEFIIIRKRNV